MGRAGPASTRHRHGSHAGFTSLNRADFGSLLVGSSWGEKITPIHYQSVIIEKSYHLLHSAGTREKRKKICQRRGHENESIVVERIRARTCLLRCSECPDAINE
jgi:hypothetical protein